MYVRGCVCVCVEGGGNECMLMPGWCVSGGWGGICVWGGECVGRLGECMLEDEAGC